MSSMRIPERARLGVAAVTVAGIAVVVGGFAGGAVAGCAGRTEAEVAIAAVTPASAYNDAKISLVIEGGPFRPVYDVDTIGGQEMTELGAFTAFLAPSSGSGSAFPADSLTWLSSSQLAAILPAGINPGPYDVKVRDPRGSLALLTGGFVSLGPDLTPPVVTIDEPVEGTIVNAGAEVPVAFNADDGLGFLSSMAWTVSSGDFQLTDACPLAPNAHAATCRFFFKVPKPTQNGQPLIVVVTAADTTNLAQAQTTLGIGLAPLVETFAPFEGPAVGGTRIVVTGHNFIARTQVVVGGALLQPGGGTVMSEALIEGTTPAHDPGLSIVTVRTGAASVDAPGTFNFVGRPEVRAVTPSSGPLAGCTPITIVGKYFRENPMTSISFGSDTSVGLPLACPSYVSGNRIEGFTPAGSGAVSVFASDPAGGVGELPLAFTYLDVDAPDASAVAPSACPCDGGAP
jgi:hypothetical protein